MRRDYGRISTLSFPIFSIYPTLGRVKINVSSSPGATASTTASIPFYRYLFTDNPPSPPEKWARNQDNQVPNRIYVYNDRIFGEKEISGTDFAFIKTDVKRLGSTKNLKTPDGIDAVIVTKTRALVDAVYD